MIRGITLEKVIFDLNEIESFVALYKIRYIEYSFNDIPSGFFVSYQFH